MDGLSALSVAASVAQFLEFGCSLVSKSKEIYPSVDGALPRNISTEDATRRLIELSEVIKSGLVLDSHQPDLASKVDDPLRSICDCRLRNVAIQIGQAKGSEWSRNAQVQERPTSAEKCLVSKVFGRACRTAPILPS
jgi:hypothetical protein